MEVNSAVSVPERPGKTSGWISFRPSRPAQEGAPKVPMGWRPIATRPARLPAGSLDPVRSAFWQTYRHLFPPHSLAAQTDNGSIVISWSVQDDPHACYPYAAPVMLRFDEHLLEAMEHSDDRQRRRIAQHHESELREGLRGYDPYARFPNARVVVIG